MIIYLLAFYLFVDIKNIGNTDTKHSASSKAILTKLHMQPNVYILYLRFALDIINGDSCDRKRKTNYLIQQKPIFRSVNLVTLLYEEMLVLTSY